MSIDAESGVGEACFSKCGKYRYALSRDWSEFDLLNRYDKPPALFIMLNPSTADENVLDPTIRRCVQFSKSWGCNGLKIGNVFALRSTDPKGLLSCADPVGPKNDEALVNLIASAQMVVCGWGSFPLARDRAKAVRKLFRDANVAPMCLGTNANGSPKHPLYLPAASKLKVFSFKEYLK